MNRRIYIIILLILSIWPTRNVLAQNNPYVDDKLFHFGFSLGVNMMSYHVTDSRDTIDGEVYHARVSGLMPGFCVGFISDVRLSRHLNLRLCPQLHFSSRTLNFIAESGKTVEGTPGNGANIDVLSIPIQVPLYLKWSAEREANYRPYLIAGGGVSYNVSRDREKPICPAGLDYFVEAGFGCDFYFSWFKFCPEIKYQIGFGNQITPVDQRPELAVQDIFYTQSIRRMTNQMITLTFNFE